MNNRFTHVQLHTGDVAASRKFYQSLFSWKFDALKDIPYTMFRKRR